MKMRNQIKGYSVRRIFNILICVLAGVFGPVTGWAADLLGAYNVVWDSPSKDATGSMPIGNGDIGLNVWVEP